MSKIEKVLATGKTHTMHSSAGVTSRGHNGTLDIALSPGNSTTPAHVFTTVQPHPTAEQLFAGADAICPYSKATRGNIEVALNVFTS